MKLLDAFKMPSWVVIQLLEQCNLRCSMCYEWGETGTYHEQHTLASLPVPLVLRLVEECLPARPLFEFFGGEPMLYSGLWEVVRRIRQGGSEVAFPTNGTLLEEHAERLVDAAPTRVWVSLDGPAAVNDQQRGRGVFQRVMRGLEKVAAVRRAKGCQWPQLGLTYVVTPATSPYITDFFLAGIDLGILACVSIELQSYTTELRAGQYAKALHDVFGVPSIPYARGYVRDPSDFAAIDIEHVTRQMSQVAAVCAERGIQFYSQPRTLDVGNIRHYFSAQWDSMIDKKTRCGVPWVCAEISARGDVTTCHTFYDLAIGNIHEQSLLDIWNGERLQHVRTYLREQLFPICTACCRYYGGASVLKTER